jgi:hypothetical protein
MMRLPRVLDGWLNDGSADNNVRDDIEASPSIDPGFTIKGPPGDLIDPGFAIRQPPTGLLSGLPAQNATSGLHLFMEPHEIAAVPGLPAAVSGNVGVPSKAVPMTMDQVDPNQLVPGRPDGNYLPASGPKNPIGPVQGYPQTGKDAWRAGNDDVIAEAVRKYNSENQRFPGDSDYMTPGLMKTWMMRESGGTPEAFKRDPFQVNNARDWDDAKGKAGLSKGQDMTPQTSADAALKWLRYKGTVHDGRGNPVTYLGHHRALERYNAADGTINGLPASSDYANTVMNNARASYGDWQQ